jgi:glycogen operon protein
MRDADWGTPGRAMTVFLNGDALTEPGPHGERVRDDSFLLMLTAERDPLEFTVPGVKYGERWAVAADSATGGPPDLAGQPELAAGDHITLTGNSMLVLRRCTAGDGG